MGSGGSAVDAMAIGCLGVERRVELFFPYLAIFPNCHCQKSLCVLGCLFLRSPSRIPYRTELIPRAPKGRCVECLIGKQKKPILFKVTEPSSIPYRTHGEGDQGQLELENPPPFCSQIFSICRQPVPLCFTIFHLYRHSLLCTHCTNSGGRTIPEVGELD